MRQAKITLLALAALACGYLTIPDPLVAQTTVWINVTHSNQYEVLGSNHTPGFSQMLARAPQGDTLIFMPTTLQRQDVNLTTMTFDVGLDFDMVAVAVAYSHPGSALTYRCYASTEPSRYQRLLELEEVYGGLRANMVC